jgi:conjugal transfer pilus assembly protein TraE
MNFKRYASTLDGAMALNRWLLIAIIGMVVVMGLMSIERMLKSQPITIEPPPGLAETSTVDRNRSDPQLMVAQGLYWVTLLGNVTPATADFLKRNVSKDLSPAIYQPVVDAIDAQTQQIEREGFRIAFSPTLARFEPSIERVLITGEITVIDPRGNEAREQRTYVLGVTTKNYRLLLDSFEVKRGAWTPSESR